MRRTIALVILAAGLAACDAGHIQIPVTEEGQRQLPDDVQVIRLTPENVAHYSHRRAQYGVTSLPSGRGWEYTVGVGDVLSVIVFDQPELTLPAGPQRTPEETGFRVQSDGTFFYPFVGQVQAAGRRPEDIRAELTRGLADFIADPQLEVRVAAFNSQRVVVTGQVGTPSNQQLTTEPLTLIEAINAAGGLLESADTRKVTVQRGGRVVPVDLAGFLEAGIARNNPVLRNGDVVNVPRRLPEEAFLLGQVRGARAIDLYEEPVSILQAIGRPGGIDEQRAHARGVFVFRSAGEITQVFQLEANTPQGLLLGGRFDLSPGDVVYVVREPLTRWNDTVARLLPFVRSPRDFDGAL